MLAERITLSFSQLASVLFCSTWRAGGAFTLKENGIDSHDLVSLIIRYSTEPFAIEYL